MHTLSDRVGQKFVFGVDRAQVCVTREALE
jgi:hypothetical protein